MDQLQEIETHCRQWITNQKGTDSAHDLAHIERVVKSAREIAKAEQADMSIVMPAAWLHDCVVLPKDHPERQTASTQAAQQAVEILAETSLSKSKYPAVAHAIEAHSFSAGIQPKTIEAKIVQDADRLDALGAIGIARCFAIGGQMGSAFYHPGDPFGENREYDDRQWTIDHFYTKLLNLPKTMHTGTARAIAGKRSRYMRQFLQQLSDEISG